MQGCRFLGGTEQLTGDRGSAGVNLASLLRTSRLPPSSAGGGVEGGSGVRVNRSEGDPGNKGLPGVHMGRAEVDALINGQSSGRGVTGTRGGSALAVVVNAIVMRVDLHREDLLGVLLTHHMTVKVAVNLQMSM